MAGLVCRASTKGWRQFPALLETMNPYESPTEVAEPREPKPRPYRRHRLTRDEWTAIIGTVIVVAWAAYLLR